MATVKVGQTMTAQMQKILNFSKLRNIQCDRKISTNYAFNNTAMLSKHSYINALHKINSALFSVVKRSQHSQGKLNIKPIGPSCQLGEGPHWDYNAQVLYYVDINDARVFKYNPKTEELTSVKLDGEHVSLVIPVEGKADQFIVTVDRSLAILTWDGKSSVPTKIEYLTTVDTEADKSEYSIFNDGKVDPTGRLWAGTRSKTADEPGNLGFKKIGVGSLYSFARNGSATPQVHNVTCSNGLAWTKDLKKMYYVDSHDEKVYSYDFDDNNGKISNQQTAFDFKSTGTKGLPDGITIDADDKLWVACFGAYQVIRVDPNAGTVLSNIEIPASQVTSVTFGGPNLDELFVTSATITVSEEDMIKNPLHGKTFQITGVGVKGTQNIYARA